MSHDIRTPINGICGMINVADHYADNMEKQTECRAKIKEASHLLLELINEVLDMSKLESDEVVLEEIPSKQTAMTTLEFVCRDTGIGMAEAFQKRIFEPFAQEHAGSRTKIARTGLGMPITKKLVEKMG